MREKTKEETEGREYDSKLKEEGKHEKAVTHQGQGEIR